MPDVVLDRLIESLLSRLLSSAPHATPGPQAGDAMEESGGHHLVPGTLPVVHTQGTLPHAGNDGILWDKDIGWATVSALERVLCISRPTVQRLIDVIAPREGVVLTTRQAIDPRHNIRTFYSTSEIVELHRRFGRKRE